MSLSTICFRFSKIHDQVLGNHHVQSTAANQDCVTAPPPPPPPNARLSTQPEEVNLAKQRTRQLQANKAENRSAGADLTNVQVKGNIIPGQPYVICSKPQAPDLRQICLVVYLW